MAAGNANKTRSDNSHLLRDRRWATFQHFVHLQHSSQIQFLSVPNMETEAGGYCGKSNQHKCNMHVEFLGPQSWDHLYEAVPYPSEFSLEKQFGSHHRISKTIVPLVLFIIFFKWTLKDKAKRRWTETATPSTIVTQHWWAGGHRSLARGRGSDVSC